MTQLADLSVSEGVPTVTLNRPDKLDAFTHSMLGELMEVFDQTETFRTFRRPFGLARAVPSVKMSG